MAAVVESVATPVPAQVVANAFVQQYYHILHHSPGLVHRFYQERSKLGRPENDGLMSITTTLQAINEKIMSLNYGDIQAEIKSVDAQESYNGGVHVLVTGSLTEKDNTSRTFSQAFFLAPQENGYFVLNDIFRYLDNANLNAPVVDDAAVPVSQEPSSIPVEEDSLTEESTHSSEEAVAEVYNPPENEIPTVYSEVPVTDEVADEVQENGQRNDEYSLKAGEVPKKSYASIVMHLKETAATFSPRPAAAPRRPPPKIVEPANVPVAPITDGPISTVQSVEIENNQDGEADGYSIYIKGLPMNATAVLLEEVFNQFGTIKNDGIQVRSNRQQGFTFGFVEFEEASSVQKALEASPLSIGGRQAFVEEKRSTNSRGNNTRGRIQPGRGSGFRGVRGGGGRGSYGGGRGGGYGSFNGRNNNEFGSRAAAGGRGGVGPTSSNRDGYQQRSGDNYNNGGGSRIPNGNAKNLSTHVSATA